MPEAAEVRQIADELQAIRGSIIKELEVLSGRYTRKPIAGTESIIGQKINSIYSRGKLIVMELENSAVLSTMGMTGYWTPSAKQPHLRLKMSTNIGSFFFADMRNFGTFKVVRHADAAKKLSTMGTDVLTAENPPIDLRKRIERYGKKSTIAEALLDQRIFCGVGNYMRADAMWGANVDPRRPAISVNDQQLESLWRLSHDIAVRAYEDPEFDTKVYGKEVTPTGSSVVKYFDDNGRRVHWAPLEQAQGDWQEE
jgi:formamidopyrimidine-DNA glycosylase